MAPDYLKQNKPYMQNRELSWLQFNQRVLDEAADDTVPLLEKLKFISIFGSNLDEFFMVRIGSLHDLSRLNKQYHDNKTGMTPREQIDAAMEALHPIYEKKDRYYKNITKELANKNIIQKRMEDLSASELQIVTKRFKKAFLPLLAPQIIDPMHPFPFLENKKLFVFLELDEENDNRIALVPIRDDFPEYWVLETNPFTYILTEDIVYHFTDLIFQQLKIKKKVLLKITRNFDFDDQNDLRDEFDNYKDYMKQILKKRERLCAVRVEANCKLTNKLKSLLLSEYPIKQEQIFITSAPLNMGYVFSLIDQIPDALKHNLLYDPFVGNPVYQVEGDGVATAFVEQQDVLLSYPYDDIQFFLRLLKEASENPRTFSIKITIYRLSKKSKLVEHLCRAAQNGIDVTVLMELRARFDEENNINYTEVLYDAGCNIIYGFEEYKTHSKVCLITYRNDKNDLRYITQIGTGNYNESTSKQYTDFSYITSDNAMGVDATAFFRFLLLGKGEAQYTHFIQAPHSLKPKFMAYIDEEISKGEEGFIFCKMNSLTDFDFINKLTEASNAGVPVRLIIRGISCLLPGISGYTENVEIHSIVGRYLEHSRVYIFGKKSDQRIYISSTDLMTRNTERRIEIAAPILDAAICKRVVDYMEIQWQDHLKGRRINEKGEYTKMPLTEPIVNAQEYFIRESNAKKVIKIGRRKARLANIIDIQGTSKDKKFQEDQDTAKKPSLWKKLLKSITTKKV